MSRVRNRAEVKSSPFSFLMPFAIAIILLILIVRYLFGGSDDSQARVGNFVNVLPKQEQSQIYIYMSGDSKKQIDGSTKLFTTDNKVQVESGEAELFLDNNPSKLYLDKGGELKYEGAVGMKESFSLLNSYLWLESNSDNLQVNLKNFKITPSTGSVLILNQNTIASNAYVLKGEALVQGSTSSVTLGVGQKITVLKSEVNSTFQLDKKIEPIDDFVRTNDFFIKHDGDSLLSTVSPGETGSGETGTGVSLSGAIKTPVKMVLFSYPEDESTVTTNTINIEGKIHEKVEKLTLNEKESSLNKAEKTFTFKDFPLTGSVNNIVYKAFDSDGILLMKGAITVYSSSKVGVTETNKPSVTTYPISDKDFKVVAPAENPYKTTDNVVRIEGRVNKGVVKYITINDFRLTKFPQFGTYWYYFANKDFGTMNDGINLYTIKYYGDADNLLFTNLFTIVKETKKEETPVVTPSTDTSTSTGATTNG